MKNRNYIQFISVLALLVSCTKMETGPGAGLSTIEIGKPVVIEGYSFQILKIDSCEYVAFLVGTKNGLLTHKGDCKNSIHHKK